MKLNSTCATLALTFGLTVAANAATIAYSYSYDLMPSHNGAGALYNDDLHSGPAGTFDSTGDLNDGVVYAGSNPVTDNPNSMVAWSQSSGADTPATITVDLGALYDLSAIDLTTYSFTAFALGHPDDVTVSTSADNVTYSGSTLHTLAAAPADGGVLQTIARTDTGVRYIQLAFDGDETSGDKWGLTEMRIDGTAVVPEPSSTALLGLGGLALILRRRK